MKGDHSHLPRNDDIALLGPFSSALLRDFHPWLLYHKRRAKWHKADPCTAAIAGRKALGSYAASACSQNGGHYIHFCQFWF